MSGKRGSTKKDVGFTTALTLVLAAMKSVGIIRCGWLVVFAPLTGTAFAGIIIATVNMLWFLRRYKNELQRNL